MGAVNATSGEAKQLSFRDITGIFVLWIFVVSISSPLAQALIGVGPLSDEAMSVNDLSKEESISILIRTLFLLLIFIYCSWKYGKNANLRYLSVNRVGIGAVIVNCFLGILLAVSFVFILFWGLIPIEESITVLESEAFFYGLGSFLLIAVWVPVIEECLYRGYFFCGIENSFGSTMASVISSLLFAISHVNFFLSSSWIPLAYLFLISFFLGYLRLKYKSIVPSIAFHGFYNGSLFALASLVFG
ncbi:MAG: type II CAAX endopeptidase family protein [Pseudohongiellaceae bacterium]|nr:type II CAAX endopeptidase family protein [Pseudohongiellaceae bacterium]